MKDITKALIVFAVIVVGYFVYINVTNKQINNIHPENFIGKIKKYIPEPFADITNDEVTSGTDPNEDQTNSEESSEKESSEEVDAPVVEATEPVISNNNAVIKQKFINRNSSINGHKKSNYADGMRGNFGNSEWSQYFDQVSDLTNNIDKYRNDNFQPNEVPNNAQAMHRLYNKKGLEKPEDLFDVDKFLPKDVRDDWFEVMPEPISAKNRHLINITRPIGVNTIGTSLRNPSHDIRGAPPNPKYIVSPWLQSSIEPDINIKPVI